MVFCAEWQNTSVLLSVSLAWVCSLLWGSLWPSGELLQAVCCCELPACHLFVSLPPRSILLKFLPSGECSIPLGEAAASSLSSSSWRCVPDPKYGSQDQVERLSSFLLLGRKNISTLFFKAKYTAFVQYSRLLAVIGSPLADSCLSKLSGSRSIQRLYRLWVLGGIM